MSSLRIYQAAASDWDKLPLIYEADCYFMAAGGMRRRAPAELREFEAGDRLLYFAEVETRVIGTVGLIFQGLDLGQAAGRTSANVHRLHVVKAHRRAGVATALMSAAEDDALRRGYSRLVLEVEAENVGARRLYEHLGYRYEHGVMAGGNPVMTKVLPPISS